MRRLALFIVIFLIFSLAPSVAPAFESRFTAGRQAETGSLDLPGGDADYSADVFSLSYTRFMRDLETDDSPYGAREFLQHPSNLYVSLGFTESEMDSNVTNYKTEDTTSELVIGGELYFSESTGVALSLGIESGEEEESGATPGKTEHEEKEIDIALVQYFGEGVRLTPGLMSGSGEEDDGTAKSEYDFNVAYLDVTALLDMLVLGAVYQSGETEYDDGTKQDLTGTSLRAGYFVSQSTLLGLRYSTRKVEDSYKIKETSLGGEHYFSERIYLEFDLYSGDMDFEGQDAELSYAGIALDLGFYF